MDEDQIRSFLERYGQALSSGDLATIVSCWAVPALVLSDQGSVAVSDPAEIERFFGQAVQAYHARGWMSTRPDLHSFEALSATLLSVDVHWLAYDAAGDQQSSERSYYLLARGSDRQLRIRVAVTR